ncbi:hypothetical protein B0H14DRAFT_2445985 [Mycena olivaceomarginata]|nr:hypothetical protein B0H14DRAFT_2445985 [Mycena olivaceomarginata]
MMIPLLLYALCSLLVARLPFSSAANGDVAEASPAPAAVTATLSLAASKWIWTPTTTTNALVALRKDFTPPLGKALIGAEIIMNAESAMDLYVNGIYVGSGTEPHRLLFAGRFCVDLLPSYNVFAVNASNTVTVSSGAVIATILLTYSDGTTDTLVTDSSWRVMKGLPVGFEQLAFDDTTWPVATISGAYGASEWSAVNIAADPAVIGLVGAEWIWTDVVPASGVVPVGSRAFRRTFIPAPGQTPMSASILIAADNEWTLYVNGVTVGTGTGSAIAQNLIVNFGTPTSEVVFAVLGTNLGSASRAGVLVAMEINMQPSGRTNCTAGSFVLSDVLWKSAKGAIPTGFEQPGFDDSAWPAVVAEEIYGAGPTWGAVTIAAPSPPVTV